MRFQNVLKIHIPASFSVILNRKDFMKMWETALLSKTIRIFA